jgi:hypothetical protein
LIAVGGSGPKIGLNEIRNPFLAVICGDVPSLQAAIVRLHNHHIALDEIKVVRVIDRYFVESKPLQSQAVKLPIMRRAVLIEMSAALLAAKPQPSKAGWPMAAQNPQLSAQKSPSKFRPVSQGDLPARWVEDVHLSKYGLNAS